MLESDLMLYLVTDRKMAGDKLEEIVETAIKSGVTMVQLREKQASFEEFCEKAKQMKKVCDKYNIPLIINDSVEVCLAVDAAGSFFHGLLLIVAQTNLFKIRSAYLGFLFSDRHFL